MRRCTRRRRLRQRWTGLWIAATTGADYVGVDIAASALAAVTRRAERLGLAERVRTVEGSFESLPLGDGEAQAIMSIDAMLFTPDKRAAATEMARVLAPGGRLVATTWDYHTQPRGRPPQVDDHRPLLAAAGFEVTTYEDTPEQGALAARDQLRLLDSVSELAAESGEDDQTTSHRHRGDDGDSETMLRRVLIVATRR